MVRIVLPLKSTCCEFAELAHDLVVEDILPNDKTLYTVSSMQGAAG